MGGVSDRDGSHVDGTAGGTEPVDVGSLFTTPRWLRDLGRTSWLLVGLLLVLAGATWLLAATYTIVGPILGALIVAVVAIPVVRLLNRHLPNAASAAVVLLAIAAIAVFIVVIVVAGISGQRGAISAEASKGVDRAQSWLTSAGVGKSSSEGAASSLKKQAPQAVSTLVHGVVAGIGGLVSLFFGLSFAALGTFFLLKDGPGMRRWLDRHVGLPEPVAYTISSAVIRSLRGYFRGVTVVAAFNGVIVGLGALLLGVPLAGTIGVVSFATAYVPYIGAFVAGVFAVVIALGAKGTAVAIAMLIIFLLANGLLQNIVQPFAMGSALDLNPLVVLVVTIAAGCLFGTIGLVLAAPLVSAASRAVGELRGTRVSTAAAEPAPVSAPPVAAGPT
jgi:putative heme transporter